MYSAIGTIEVNDVPKLLNRTLTLNSICILIKWKWSNFMGKNTPIFAFSPTVNLNTRLMRMEQDSWKTMERVEAHPKTCFTKVNATIIRIFLSSRKVHNKIEGKIWKNIKTKFKRQDFFYFDHRCIDRILYMGLMV